jgi:hypothetical protein
MSINFQANVMGVGRFIRIVFSKEMKYFVSRWRLVNDLSHLLEAVSADELLK